MVAIGNHKIALQNHNVLALNTARLVYIGYAIKRQLYGLGRGCRWDINIACKSKVPGTLQERGYNIRTGVCRDSATCQQKRVCCTLCNKEISEYAYSCPAKPVRDHMAQNKQVILEIDYQGAMQIKQSMPQAHLVFIEPPSLEVLEQRLRNRATEDDTTIKKRLAVARLQVHRQP